MNLPFPDLTGWLSTMSILPAPISTCFHSAGFCRFPVPQTGLQACTNPSGPRATHHPLPQRPKWPRKGWPSGQRQRRQQVPPVQFPFCFLV